MKLYIAKNENGALWIYGEQPYPDKCQWLFDGDVCVRLPGEFTDLQNKPWDSGFWVWGTKDDTKDDLDFFKWVDLKENEEAGEVDPDGMSDQDEITELLNQENQSLKKEINALKQEIAQLRDSLDKVPIQIPKERFMFHGFKLIAKDADDSIHLFTMMPKLEEKEWVANQTTGAKAKVNISAVLDTFDVKKLRDLLRVNDWQDSLRKIEWM